MSDLERIYRKLSADTPSERHPDTVRLDFLEAWLRSDEKASRSVESWEGDGNGWHYGLAHVPDSYGGVWLMDKPTLRGAIDAAMAAGKAEE